MSIHGRIHIGADETLHVSLPGFAGKDVEYTIDLPRTGTNGVSGAGNAMPAKKAMSAEEWKKFVRDTAGSMPDFPDIERPGPDSYERREEL